MTFKEWLLTQEEFGQGPTGMGGTGMLLKDKKKEKRSKIVVLPRDLEQDRHTADRIDYGSS